jgi:hypothetical protein
MISGTGLVISDLGLHLQAVFILEKTLNTFVIANEILGF